MRVPKLLRRKVMCKVVKRFTLNGTIDGHDPILVRFQILGPKGMFYLTVCSVNLGRGYDPGEFKANVLKVLDRVDAVEHVVILFQEIDEADASPEHKVIRELMEKGTYFVEWFTREPIAVSPGATKVWRQRKVMTMDQGSNIGAPSGTGPRRFFVSCLAEIEGVIFGFGNQHPHRNIKNSRVQKARSGGEKVTRKEVRKLVRRADVTIYGGDMNDTHYPKAHPKEQVGIERDLDTIRYVVA